MFVSCSGSFNELIYNGTLKSSVSTAPEDNSTSEGPSVSIGLNIEKDQDFYVLGEPIKYSLTFDSEVDPSLLTSDLFSSNADSQGLTYTINQTSDPKVFEVVIDGFSTSSEFELSFDLNSLKQRSKKNFNLLGSISNSYYVSYKGAFTKIKGITPADIVGDLEYVGEFGDYLFFKASDILHSYNTLSGTGENLGVDVEFLKTHNFVPISSSKAIFIGKATDGFNALYVTDGTSAGTSLLNEARTNGHDFTNNTSYHLSLNRVIQVMGPSLAYFISRDSTHTAIWQTDGTPSGTSKINNISTANMEATFIGANSSYAFFLQEVPSEGLELFGTNSTTTTKLTSGNGTGDYLYLSYAYMDPVVINEQVFFHGKSDGLYRVSDLNPPTLVQSDTDTLLRMQVINGRYFVTITNSMYEINPSDYSISLMFNLTSIDSKLYDFSSSYYFVGHTSTSCGSERLYTWDGSSAPVQIGTAAISCSEKNLNITDDDVYFIGSDTLLYSYNLIDGERAVVPTSVDARIGDSFYSINGDFYFSGEENGVSTIFKTDGNLAGLQRIATVDSHNRLPKYLSTINGKNYIMGSNLDYRDELFSLNDSGMTFEYDSNPGLTSYGSNIVLFEKGNFTFIRIIEKNKGNSLWAVNKVSAVATFLSRGAFNEENFITLDEYIIYPENDGGAISLVSFNTNSGEKNTMISNLNIHPANLEVEFIVESENYAFFTYRQDGNDFHSLFRTDGTLAGTISLGVEDIKSNPNSSNFDRDDKIVKLGGDHVLFMVDISAGGFSQYADVISTDGSVIGTHKIVNVNSGANSGNSSMFYDDIDDTLWIGAGRYILKSTTLLTGSYSLFLDPTNSDHSDSQTGQIARLGDLIVFTNGWVGYELFSSDINVANGELVDDFIIGGFYADFNRFFNMEYNPIINGKMFLLDNDQNIQVSDGTAAGTTEITGPLTAYKKYDDKFLYAIGANVYAHDGLTNTLVFTSPNHNVVYVYFRDGVYYYFTDDTTEGRLMIYDGTNHYDFGSFDPAYYFFGVDYKKEFYGTYDNKVLYYGVTSSVREFFVSLKDASATVNISDLADDHGLSLSTVEWSGELNLVTMTDEVAEGQLYIFNMNKVNP